MQSILGETLMKKFLLKQGVGLEQIKQRQRVFSQMNMGNDYQQNQQNVLTNDNIDFQKVRGQMVIVKNVQQITKRDKSVSKDILSTSNSLVSLNQTKLDEDKNQQQISMKSERDFIRKQIDNDMENQKNIIITENLLLNKFQSDNEQFKENVKQGLVKKNKTNNEDNSEIILREKNNQDINLKLFKNKDKKQRSESDKMTIQLKRRYWKNQKYRYDEFILDKKGIKNEEQQIMQYQGKFPIINHSNANQIKSSLKEFDNIMTIQKSQIVDQISDKKKIFQEVQFYEKRKIMPHDWNQELYKRNSKQNHQQNQKNVSQIDSFRQIIQFKDSNQNSMQKLNIKSIDTNNFLKKSSIQNNRYFPSGDLSKIRHFSHKSIKNECNHQSSIQISFKDKNNNDENETNMYKKLANYFNHTNNEDKQYLQNQPNQFNSYNLLGQINLMPWEKEKTQTDFYW